MERTPLAGQEPAPSGPQTAPWIPDAWNPWANDTKLLDLYRRRCRAQAEEMTCAAQAAEILAERAAPGETLLDAGCGGGYYYHSLRRRKVDVEYHGLDYTPSMIRLAREEMGREAGLAPDRFHLEAIERMDTPFDNILCFNVLTTNPHYAQPLERLLKCARKRVVLRESLGDTLDVSYAADRFLDEEKRHIAVYHNTYPIREVTLFMESFGFAVIRIADRRTKDGMEMVCDVPHHWKILVAERRP